MTTVRDNISLEGLLSVSGLSRKRKHSTPRSQFPVHGTADQGICSSLAGVEIPVLLHSSNAAAWEVRQGHSRMSHTKQVTEILNG